MRRKLYSLTAGLAAALLLGAACSSDDTAEKPVPEPATLTAPALTLSADAVLIDPELSDQPALHAEWTAATDDEQTEVAYTLYVNLTDRDMFSGPVVIDKGAALTHDFTHGELNQLLLNTFDLEAGTEAAVRFAVYAKNADEEFDAQLSEIISCAITPKTTYPNFPPSLIMVGAATPWQWDLNAGLELPESREGSHQYQASGVELRVQPMSLNNGFKFYFSRNVNDTDDPRFAAQDLSAETFGKIAVYKSGEAQFQPGSFGYENGVYDIEVNLDTKLLTLTRTGDLPEAPAARTALPARRLLHMGLDVGRHAARQGRRGHLPRPEYRHDVRRQRRRRLQDVHRTRQLERLLRHDRRRHGRRHLAAACHRHRCTAGIPRQTRLRQGRIRHRGKPQHDEDDAHREKHRLLDRLFDDRRSHSGRLGKPHLPAQEGRQRMGSHGCRHEFRRRLQGIQDLRFVRRLVALVRPDSPTRRSAR